MNKPGELTPEQRENLIAAADAIYTIVGEDVKTVPGNGKKETEKNQKKET